MQSDWNSFNDLTLTELRNLPLDRLEQLAEEMRQAIVSVCFSNGGHLGASLGAVEIAIALHRVFESPQEPIIWDVGHQAYAHKLLTGRWKKFHTLRKKGGISGFLSRKESVHDVFGAGHSSTALSAALALAWAPPQESEAPGNPASSQRWTVAVVGDGGLTGGLAFEALNNCGNLPLGPLLVVLNDNQMSISKNSGAIAELLADRGKAASFFGGFGFDYRGPVDGHDLRRLIETLSEIRSKIPEKPVILHVFTQKGRGYFPAEELPETYHGVSPVRNPLPSKVGNFPKNVGSTQLSYSETFGHALCELAARESRIVAITAAMPEGTGLGGFARKFPHRFFDVGIAEQHAVTFAAGLATRGHKPVVAIYSTFLQRALDSVIHDVALQELDVVFALDRSGIVGSDGPTHHGSYDLAYLSMIPGMKVWAPASLSDLSRLLDIAVKSCGPCAIRYPRGSGPLSIATQRILGEGVAIVRESERPELIVVTIGACTERGLKAIESFSLAGSPKDAAGISLVSLTQIKPLPTELFEYLALYPSAQVLTVEDGVVSGGIGHRILAKAKLHRSHFEAVGYGDHPMGQGTPEEVEEEEGLSASGLATRMRRLLNYEKAN